MPPEVPHHGHPLIPSIALFPPPVSPSVHSYPPLIFKHFRENKSMNVVVTRKKIIHVLVLILSALSILRLLRITITTSSSSSSTTLYALPPSLQYSCSSSTCSINLPRTTANASTLSEKEYKLLSDLISDKSPCNILIFGLEKQYLTLSKINAGGSTVILEDDPNKISSTRKNSCSNSTRIYKIDYQTCAENAYKLLIHARENTACKPNSGVLQQSKCRLALINLAKEVYEMKWDLIIVDGPRGDKPEAPGRMAAIYSAGIIARDGNTTTDVAVHDVNRMIEKWFSWEFLCDENLVSSKGKFWIFRIKDQLNSSKFCPGRIIATE